ncbi:DUF2155 domain-containing protein [Pelagibacteraceae bacterium]|nr:DUF2155 domain-containing protein [Candidatus Pelagibacter sp.]MDC1485571.1 DUF2155 domain-containing protein [Pelagibacteraceae bacterium]
MKLIKSIKAGRLKILYFIFVFNIIFYPLNIQGKTIDTKFIEIKILDKVSSKSSKLTLEIRKEKKFKNLLIKFLKCKNSEFDDTPEVTAYIQVKDINNVDNDEVFVFNGWTFSSSPSLRPLDHPVYDMWLLSCY